MKVSVVKLAHSGLIQNHLSGVLRANSQCFYLKASSHETQGSSQSNHRKNLFHVCQCYARMEVPCVCLLPTESGEGVAPPETIVTVGRELPREFWEPTSGPLLEHQVFLIPETSPCPSGLEGSTCFCFPDVLLEESVLFHGRLFFCSRQAVSCWGEASLP